MKNITFNYGELDNGLRIIHSNDFATQSFVCVNTLYDVGAKDEDEEHTGLAHLMEHLMFTGSENAKNFDEPLLKALAKNNAYTTNDLTDYYIVLPPENIDTALFLESDRMKSLTLGDRSIEIQKGVVTEEYKERYLNRPYGDLLTLRRKLCYTRHPYKWTAIGKSTEQIENVDNETIRDFYRHHYAPNNAILAVTGNIGFDEVMKKVGYWYRDVERRDVKRRELPEEPELTEDRVLTVRRNVPNSLVNISIRVDGLREGNNAEYDFLTDILANGESSRLHRMQHDNDNFISVDAVVSSETDYSTIEIVGLINDGLSAEEAKELMMKETERAVDDITDRNIQKYKNRKMLERDSEYEDYKGAAERASKAFLLGSIEDYHTEYAERFCALEKNDILRAMDKVMTKKKCVLNYIAEDKKDVSLRTEIQE